MPAKVFGETRYSPPSLSHIWPRSHKFPVPILVGSSELLASGYRVQAVPGSEAQPSCLGAHTVLSLAKQLAERRCSNQCLLLETNIADFFVLFAISPGLQKKSGRPSCLLPGTFLTIFEPVSKQLLIFQTSKQAFIENLLGTLHPHPPPLIQVPTYGRSDLLKTQISQEDETS